MAKILIIEDDPYVRRFYERLFRLSNHEVEMAAGGKEGLDKTRIFLPDLVLLDIMMPDMDGLEVLKKLKADPKTSDCEVVMLTVIEDAESVKKAASLGASGFVVKSDMPPEKLLDEVNKYLKAK